MYLPWELMMAMAEMDTIIDVIFDALMVYFCALFNQKFDIGYFDGYFLKLFHAYTRK